MKTENHSDKCKGSCLCGAVAYEINSTVGTFQYCHCSRCRKVTGSAHAANILIFPDQFKWTKGSALVQTYTPPETHYFATAFCQQCGAFLPWTAKGGKVVVVPAGTLDDDPQIAPSQNIFCGSKAVWYKAASDLPDYDTVPSRKT